MPDLLHAFANQVAAVDAMVGWVSTAVLPAASPCLVSHDV
jgi:hypothetical protein